jgi:MraZ protein
VQHAILLGEYDLTIDAKSRCQLPADVKRAIDPKRDGDFLYLIIGAPNRKPWLYPAKIYESMAAKYEPDFAPDADVLAFKQIFYSMASRVDWDKQGRILISDKVLRRTNTGREITMIGAGDHLEIWNRSDWENQFEQHLNNMPMLAKQMKEQQVRTLGPQ